MTKNTLYVFFEKAGCVKAHPTFSHHRIHFISKTPKHVDKSISPIDNSLSLSLLCCMQILKLYIMRTIKNNRYFLSILGIGVIYVSLANYGAKHLTFWVVATATYLIFAITLGFSQVILWNKLKKTKQ